ncbi:MAG: NUDIX domain-containing protein [Methanomassiliicoccaceae archaeon]|nr:NUDIX domain-containing protein [Methanomassiliicoccaceae archaeon]
MDSIFDYEHPFVCTDAAIFTIKTEESDNYRKLPGTSLQILLYKRATDPYMGRWCLPGGFLDIDETPEDNIRRKVSEKSYVGECRLEQLHTFCDPGRDPRARVISIAYLGLMSEAESTRYEDKAAWFSVRPADGSLAFERDGLLLTGADIGFDHLAIIEAALGRMRSGAPYTDIVFDLLPEEFTLTQLQNVYEAILGRRDQTANFRRKVIDMVQETDNYTSDKGHRPARLYTKKQEVKQ